MSGGIFAGGYSGLQKTGNGRAIDFQLSMAETMDILSDIV
jgi:hypothetical protein